MSNVGALDQVRRLLREHPEVHYQGMYACGTTACIAGWAVALDRGLHVGRNIQLALTGVTGRRIASAAQRLLGLTDAEAVAVFISAKNEEDALELVDAIIARDKGEATASDHTVLRRYGLPGEPAGDAA